MIVIIATLQVIPGKTEVFERFMADLAKSVIANEPDTHVYQLCRIPGLENAYRMIEFYTDQAAIDAVKQWVYTPTLLNGVPVPVIMTVTVNFKLS